MGLREPCPLFIQYQDVFMSPDGTLGITDLAKHETDTENEKPIKIHPRRIPIFKRNHVDEELDKMLSQGIVEPGYSSWSAPICLVKKKDGYPLPRIDDTLNLLSESMWFSTLELASGYW